MANPGYMTVLDQNGEAINGDCKVKDRENSIEVYAFEHSLKIPIDKHDGSLTGTRQHGNFIVTKGFCPASPILYKTCSSGRTLKSIALSWYRIDDTGKEIEYFRHDLSDVKVVSIGPIVNDVKDERYAHIGHREQVAFRYSKISWTYLDGNIQTEDSWLERA